MHWSRPARGARFGGYTARATARSILSLASARSCCGGSLEVADTSSTVKQPPRNRPARISMPADISMRARSPALSVPLNADFYLCGPAAFLQDLTRRSFALRRPRRVGSTPRPSVPRGRRRPGSMSSGRPRMLPAGAGRAGSAHLVCAIRALRRLGFALPEPARAERGVRRSGALVVPHGGMPQL